MKITRQYYFNDKNGIGDDTLPIVMTQRNDGKKSKMIGKTVVEWIIIDNHIKYITITIV